MSFQYLHGQLLLGTMFCSIYPTNIEPNFVIFRIEKLQNKARENVGLMGMSASDSMFGI